MKLWILGEILLVVSGLGAEPLTLINTLPDRPVFNLVTAGVTQTRTVAPGNRIAVDAGTFSGLGEKNVRLSGGATYYFARFGAVPALYRLAAGQVLILNQAGRPVSVTLASPPASAVLAAGNLALGELASGQLTVAWDDGSGAPRSASLTAGGVYRLVLASPQGTGTGVDLTAWN